MTRHTTHSEFFNSLLALQHHILHDQSEFEDRFRIHGVKETYPIQFKDGVDSYNLTIQFHATVSATGTVNADDLACAREVLLSCSRAEAQVSAEGGFSLRGIVPSEGGILYVLNKVHGMLTRHVIAATQTTTDVALGIVKEQPPDETGRLALTLHGLVPEVPEDSSERVVLVSRDGSRLYQFKVDKDGKARAWNRDDEELRLAPGEYFVFPGSITSVFAEKVVRLALANRAEDLTKAQVPKVTVTTAAPVAVTIESKSVWNQIEQISE